MRLAKFLPLFVLLAFVALTRSSVTSASPAFDDQKTIPLIGEVVTGSMTIPPGYLQVKGIFATTQTYHNGTAPVCQKSDQYGATYAEIANQSWTSNSFAVSVGVTEAHSQAVVVDFTCVVGERPLAPTTPTQLQYLYPPKTGE